MRAAAPPDVGLSGSLFEASRARSMVNVNGPISIRRGPISLCARSNREVVVCCCGGGGGGGACSDAERAIIAASASDATSAA